MSLQQHFLENWHNHFKSIVPTNAHFFIAVSGGVDSVVLTDVLFHAGFDFTILHANFQLRGEESMRDEQFVQSLQEKYNKPVIIERFHTTQYAEQHRKSVQLAARELRYQWFNEVMNKLDIEKNRKFLVTAHHADDNIETVWMNICRGTGIKGLSGIPASQNNILRPLLFARRQEIINYAQEQNILWIEDSSNTSDKYARNFFRHNILPLTKEVFATSDENMIHNIAKWKEVSIIYDLYIQQQKEKLLEVKGNEVHIPIAKLKKQPALNTLIHEIIVVYGFTSAQVQDILLLLQADTGKYISSATHRIIKNRYWLIIAPLQTLDAAHIIIENDDKEIFFADKKMMISINDVSKITDNAQVACLDATHISFPLILRKWKQGDYFYPLGMRKKKKIARLLIDAKLSTTEKENVWIVESNKKIIWVVGHRIDDRFKIKDTTQKKLQLIVS
ncbi:MAG: tRNA lysidine(34) synthetase TilS [Chitinophagaceae bacterium]|nr:tRNA lysidine(34) synthetase TilS [Chitinophagaceae bacterium]MCW5905534.1 tRNA lysidine(34) synthetase TilS [Chitinophagaceae bacterium]